MNNELYGMVSVTFFKSFLAACSFKQYNNITTDTVFVVADIIIIIFFKTKE